MVLAQSLGFFSLQQHLQYYVIYGQADKKKTLFETVKGQLLIVFTQQTKCCALVKYRKQTGWFLGPYFCKRVAFTTCCSKNSGLHNPVLKSVVK